MVKKFALLFMLCCAASSAAMAEGYGTAEEAKKLLDKAVSHLKDVGADAAYKDFSDSNGKFVDRDLYVFCDDMDGLIVAHGANPAVIGKNLYAVKDPDGKQFIKEMVDVAGTLQVGGGLGQVSYKWTNPQTKTIQTKTSFFKRTSEKVFCGVGIFKPD